jgi:hypothetical protein
MNKKILSLIAIQSITIMLLIWVIIFIGQDEIFDDENNEELETKSFVTHNQDGLVTIKITEAIEKNSGIETSTLKKSVKDKILTYYGTVIGTDALVDLKNIHDQLNTEKSQLAIQQKSEKTKLNAFIALNKQDKNISDQALREQTVLTEQIVQKIKNNNELQVNLKQKIENQWGKIFYETITGISKDKEITNLLNGKSKLIKITIPSIDTDLVPTKEVIFSPINGNEEIAGYFLANAPSIDNEISGQTYFYIIHSNQYRIGSKIVAFLTNKSTGKRYEVPSTAIVWNNGLPYIYVKTMPGGYVKKPLSLKDETPDGWIIDSDFLQEQDKIVIQGSQLLLSEEYKYQIKNENED